MAHILVKKKPSNKTETPGKEDANFQSMKVHGPFIDKISIIVTCAVPDRHEIYDALFTCLDDAELFAPGPTGRVGGFQIGRRIKLASIVDFKKLPSVHFDIDKKQKGVDRVRLEFVPVDLGSTGLEELGINLTTFIPDGWLYVIVHGHITRFDISVDIDVPTDAFLFLPVLSTGTMQYRFNGKLQSLYFGKTKGNQTTIYDRQAKRIAKDQYWPSPSTRIERRLINLKGLKLTDLLEFENPFKKMVLLENPPKAPVDVKEWEWRLFCDAIVVRGLTDALAILPEDKRTKYRAHLKLQNLLWWQPEELWKGWKPMLNDLKLATGNI